MNTDTDDNVTEISVNDNFGELPIKEPVKLRVENKEAYVKTKFHLHTVSPVDPLETENEEAEIKDNYLQNFDMKNSKKQYRCIISFLSFLVFFLPKNVLGATESELFDAQISLAVQQEISWFYFTQIVNLSVNLFFIYIILYVLIFKPIVKPLLSIKL